jgi:hypothetical protein
MKVITLEQAKRILEDSAAVMVDDNALVYPSICDLTEDGDNEWMYLQWADEKGYEYNVKFVQENNKEITVVGGSMFLQDSEGEQCQLTILVPAKLD